MGEIEVTRDQNIAVRKDKVSKEDSNLLQVPRTLAPALSAFPLTSLASFSHLA